MAERSRAELDAAELVPYRQMMSELDTIMTGHTCYPCFDAKPTPSSLSANTINKLLREELGYRGLVLSDPFSEARFNELDRKVWQLRVETLGKAHAKEFRGFTVIVSLSAYSRMPSLEMIG